MIARFLARRLIQIPVVAGVLTLMAACQIQPARVTAPVGNDPDDPAIWLNTADPAKSLILGTNKAAAPDGALVVFNLDGTVRQTIRPLDRPNNVDVEYGFSLGGRSADIAVVTERLQHRLRVYRIPSGGGALEDISADGGVPVLADQAGDASEPMGIALYRRPRDGAVFAIVSPKSGGATDYLWQYRLTDEGSGRVTATLVRRFGNFSRRGPTPGEIGEIEAVMVDDELGYVYYADERFGIHKWQADPDHPEAARELGVFGTSGYKLDREGLAVYAGSRGTGYLVSTDQIPGGSILRLYRREGTATKPHDHQAVVGVIPTSSDETDGIEIISRPLPGFPDGLLVMMNSGPKNFLLYDWREIAAQITR